MTNKEKCKHKWHNPDDFIHLRICLDCGRTEEKFGYWRGWREVGLRSWEGELDSSRRYWEQKELDEEHRMKLVKEFKEAKS